MDKLIGPITFISGLLISSVAAYFSVVGLAKIFASAATAVIVMGAVLEVGKLAAASWLFRNWRIAPTALKSYLTVAVVVLMMITSLGIFGYLSKSYDDQIRPVASKQIEIESLQSQLALEQDRIKRAQTATDQINKQVDSLMGDAERSVEIRRRQTRERNALTAEIKEATKNSSALKKSLSDLQVQTNIAEHEVGPINFIAKMLFSNEERSSVDRAVQFMIGLLVLVFDPLAISLLLAANFSSLNKKQQKHHNEVLNRHQPEPIPTPIGNSNNNVTTVVEQIPDIPETVDEIETFGEIIHHADGSKSIKGH